MKTWITLITPRTSETISSLYLPYKYLPGVLNDMENPNEPGDVLNSKTAAFRSFFKSFIKIECMQPCQDSTCHLSHFLESWKTWSFMMNLEMVLDLKKYSTEASVKYGWDEYCCRFYSLTFWLANDIDVTSV